MSTETINLQDLPQWLANREKLVGTIDYGPAFAKCRVLFAQSAKRNFAAGADPEGRAWLPLKNPSKRRGGPTAKPLRDTGMLMASMTAGGAGHYEVTLPLRMEWGTAVFYAGFHQEGTRFIPARPFLGLNDALLEDVGNVLGDFAAEQMAK